ncbi:DUF1775 domain-containing protein [Miltoncostaea oceani]|uniref:DUF1775 domain-containing protein n=1 Tax=Miltoncostaea oceani TaxID=2843216 RepID=UPI001C3C6F00|nr:DUF1775 domain-containing protein [Miltoncostaea oceani]
MRTGVLVLGVIALMAVGAGPAVGHVDVLPSEVAAGSAEKFTIRVPSERAEDTVAVRVSFPTQISVYSVNPAAGWTARILYRPDRRMRGVIFRGGRIGEDQFQEFEVLGTPQEAGSAVWKTTQTYSDGVVKPWTGPPEALGDAAQETGPEAPGPASATEIRVAGSEGPPAAEGDGSGSSDDYWLGLVAIGVSILAVVGVGLLWATRPARLPEDDG